MKHKILDNIKLGARLLFYGMKAGDNELSQTSNEGTEINHHVTVAGPMADLLQEKETDEVKEVRDEYYRIFKEADKYHVDLEFSHDDDGNITGDISASSRKKTLADFTKHCVVDETDGLKLRVIQENDHIGISLEESLVNHSLYNYKTRVNILYNDFTPRYLVDKFLTKIVVKEYNNTEAILDLYFPTIAGQFTTLDAIFIGELNKIFKDKTYKSEIIEMSEVSFITEHAWNSEALCLFKYDNLEFQDISIFDGSFVLKMKGHIVNDGTSVTEQYETEELTEKYKNKAPKKDATDIFAVVKQIGGINFGVQTFKLDNEDSN